MPLNKLQSTDLKVGSLVRDIQTGDLGLLVERINIFQDIDEHEPVWVWEMTWAGPATDSFNRNTPFIEQAILGLLNGGVWELSSDEAT
jgi:hypothetical protein